jgi:hypothetical protein
MESSFPTIEEAKSHCGLSAKRSSGINRFASLMRRMRSWGASVCGRLVLINPRTTILSSGTCRSGANEPDRSSGDEAGSPLDGANKYTLHFEKGATPPVNAFWSVTLYDTEGFQVANPLNRFAVSSWVPFKYDPDGSLTLYFQNQNPGKDKEANWLPAPKGPSI